MAKPRKLILECALAPGDIVMLTAAVRDLHACYPGRFITDVRTSCDELWRHNPHLKKLSAGEAGVEVISCTYPLVALSNRVPYHCLHGFIDFLNSRLGLEIRPSAFHGDIHLSREEKRARSRVHELAGRAIPFWVISGGGKPDLTIKWWDTARYQKVIDHFRGRIQFVQVGQIGHHHPPLRGVIDLRGRTSLRDLVHLIHHAQGVLCGVTSLMHLAAAVETRGQPGRRRPCVVVAGGREPAHWEAYPGHQYIHTIGALPCCARGGCWKSRTLPLGDGRPQDRPDKLCVNVVGRLPRCMDMITPEEVARRIETYFEGGTIRYLSKPEAKAATRAVARTSGGAFDKLHAVIRRAQARAVRFIEDIPPYPGGFHGKGIVICAGGPRHFTNAWVCIQMLRRTGCTLPIQMWHLGRAELDERMKRMVEPFGVECVDAFALRRKHPVRRLGGWELKPYAILHSPFREVLLIDADNVPVMNPEPLFAAPPYRRTGAVFWPDYNRLHAQRPIWFICGVDYRDEPEIESGQILVDKQKCWESLWLAWHYNNYSDFYYRFIYGDKDTFHMAFRKLGQSYAMPSRPVHPLRGVICQHDFAGRRLFQHRNVWDWKLHGKNRHIEDFWFEKECLGYLKELRARWDGVLPAETTSRLVPTTTRLFRFNGPRPRLVPA